MVNEYNMLFTMCGIRFKLKSILDKTKNLIDMTNTMRRETSSGYQNKSFTMYFKEPKFIY